MGIDLFRFIAAGYRAPALTSCLTPGQQYDLK
jgi:hypothetical protein